MRVYRERLGVPISWWLLITACVVLLGTTLWAGLSVPVAVLIYVVLECAAAITLLAWGSARIEVTQSELLAGSQLLPLTRIAHAAPMDTSQTRALRGPRADPAAFFLVRPYLPQAVYVEIVGRPAERPYWLIATRKPTELADAIERARTAGHGAGYAEAAGSRTGDQAPWDDAAGDHVTRAGAARPASAAHRGKDTNAR